jgi:PTH1 family peptidyl-tRNA hydrolase
MILIVGLGNPGEKYKNNRHNAGFITLDKLREKIGEVKGFYFLKPDTFMNASGKAVSKIKNFYKIDSQDIYLIHDDLDIRLGEYKVQLGVGPKVHNGVDSVEQELGTKDFWRVRVGVDNRERENRIPGEDYVLKDFTKEEKEILIQTIEKVIDELCKTLKVS